MPKMPDIGLDITMTAVRRPEVLKKTLHALYKNCLAPIIHQCRLIINIDPVGDPINSADLNEVISGYFTRYIMGMPLECSYPKALRWTWGYVSAPWVLHLADDHELVAPLNIREHMLEMKEMPTHGFRRFAVAGCDDPPSITFDCGPALCKKAFVRRCTHLIDGSINPAAQFAYANPRLAKKANLWNSSLYHHPCGQEPFRDLGRHWKRKNHYKKNGAVWDEFVTWEVA